MAGKGAYAARSVPAFVPISFHVRALRKVLLDFRSNGHDLQQTLSRRYALSDPVNPLIAEISYLAMLRAESVVAL